MGLSIERSNPLIEKPLADCLPSEAEVVRYIFPVTDRTPVHLLRLAEDGEIGNLRRKLLDYIATHKVRATISTLEAKFTARQLSPGTVAILLKTIRHYHNGLRGGLLYLAGRITEDTRLHRTKRDRVGASGPLFAAFDEFTDNPNYVVSLTVPLIRTVLADSTLDIPLANILRILTLKGMLRKDEPHLERFYGVVDELYRAGTIDSTSEEIDQENPLHSLPEKAMNAYQARRILTTRPDLSYAAVAAFMFANETVAGLLYGKLYKGFKKFQAQYGLSDHACDYFGDHASEDGEQDGPAFEESHANLMLDAVLMYAELGQEQREQIVKGVHLFLETYNELVEGLCEEIDRDQAFEKKYYISEEYTHEGILGD
jgi:hypothetical protein